MTLIRNLVDKTQKLPNKEKKSDKHKIFLIGIWSIQ